MPVAILWVTAALVGALQPTSRAGLADTAHLEYTRAGTMGPCETSHLVRPAGFARHPRGGLEAASLRCTTHLYRTELARVGYSDGVTMRSSSTPGATVFNLTHCKASHRHVNQSEMHRDRRSDSNVEREKKWEGAWAHPALFEEK